MIQFFDHELAEAGMLGAGRDRPETLSLNGRARPHEGLLVLLPLLGM